MNNSSPAVPEPVQPVSVRRHRVDWEADDLAEVTAQRALSLGTELERGCWYLNPRFTVSSPAPAAAFFRKVIELRSSWLRTCRHVQSKSGHRHQVRQANREGRRRALLMIDPEFATEDSQHRPGESILLAELPLDRRSEVLQSGHLAKQLAYSGILFIDGNPIPPRTWQARADKLLNPVADVPVIITRRRVDLAAFRSTGDPKPFETISRSVLQEHLDRQPSYATYVSPQVTVSAPSATPAFYAAASRAQAQWCILLNRTLGCGNVRRARRASDEATVSLAYSGTLVVDGLLYLPGCWPTDAPKSGRLKTTPFNSPTVPPTFLGLDLLLREDSGLNPQIVQVNSPGPNPANSRNLNELFLTLFTTGRPWPP